MKRIASFEVDHDKIGKGIYISRIDGDITTYDLRTRIPNSGDYMDAATMHSMEHLFATYIRNSALAEQVIYFGPMGCRTGFYLLIRDADHMAVFAEVLHVLKQIKAHTGPMFGATRKECGNYLEHDVEGAKREAADYLCALEGTTPGFRYPN